MGWQQRFKLGPQVVRDDPRRLLTPAHVQTERSSRPEGAPNIRRFCPWVWRLLREHQLSEFLGASGERDVEAVPAARFSGDALGVDE
jgi:hypothetical protein